MSNYINYSYTGINDLNNIFADQADIDVVNAKTLNSTNVNSTYASIQNIGCNNATINNLAVNDAASISFLSCSKLNGTDSSYYNNVRSDIQAQIDGIVNSASAGGGGYFILSAESSTLAVGYNWAFGGNQTSNFLYNVMPTCTMIGMSINCTNTITSGLTVDVY